MTEESFSSLMALVNSHLSQTKLQNDDSGTSSFRIPSLNTPNINLPTPSHRFIIPVLNPDRGPITNNVLVEQVANTIKAKELQIQKENEKENIDTSVFESTNEKFDDYEIDLSSAINDVSLSKSIKTKINNINTEVMEETFEISFKDCDIIEKPINMESRIASPLIVLENYKIKRKRVSDFGKVFCTRYKPYAAPYLKNNDTYNSIERFDFSSPSPDDILKEKQKKYQGVDILTFYGLEVSESLQRQK